MAEGTMSEAELHMDLAKSGASTPTQQIVCGGGPSLTNPAGVPFSGAYGDSRGEPTVDLRSNTDDPGIKDALTFPMTREVAHQKSFEKALCAIEENFPSGKLPGHPDYSSLYVNASQGDGDLEGPWNSGPEWDRLDDVVERNPARRGRRPGHRRRPQAARRRTSRPLPSGPSPIRPATRRPGRNSAPGRAPGGPRSLIPNRNDRARERGRRGPRSPSHEQAG
jgi:Mn-containing catalase